MPLFVTLSESEGTYKTLHFVQGDTFVSDSSHSFGMTKAKGSE